MLIYRNDNRHNTKVKQNIFLLINNNKKIKFPTLRLTVNYNKKLLVLEYLTINFLKNYFSNKLL